MSTHSAKATEECGDLISMLEELQDILDYVYADPELLMRTHVLIKWRQLTLRRCRRQGARFQFCYPSTLA